MGKVLVKNKTASPIEIIDFGITLQAGVVRNIQRKFRPRSAEFKTLIDDGDVVFTEIDETELTTQESQDALAAYRCPTYECYYTASQVDDLLGKVKQFSRVKTTTAFSTTSLVAPGSTPTYTSGVLMLSKAFTATSTSNVLLIECVVPVAPTANTGCVLLLVDSTNQNVLAVAFSNIAGATQLAIRHPIATPDATEVTYELRIGTSVTSQTAYFNRTAAAAAPFGGKLKENCMLTITEIDNS
jgi:hypothetical protein